MEAAIYARVSSRGQVEEGTSLETQVEGCLSFARETGFDVPDSFVFREQASGADSNRSMLSEVRRLARDRRIDALIVFHPDRLSRDATDLMVISEEIAEAGVQLLFVHGPSGNSPEDKLMRFIFGYKGEAERRDTLERTLRGKRKTATDGKMPVGTGRGLFGYRQRWVSDNESGRPKLQGREIVEDEAHVVRRIFEMATSGDSAYAIAVSLNNLRIPTKTGGAWHPATLKNLLKNPAYMGDTYYGKTRARKVKNSSRRRRSSVPDSEWILIEGFTPPIISREAFQAAQEKLQAPRSRPGKALTPYLLTGHIVCALCDTSLVGTTLNRRYRYYRCRGTFPTAATPRHCDASYVRAGNLEDAVWGTIHDVLEQPEVVLAQLRQLTGDQQTPIEEEIAMLRREIRRCKDQELRLVKLYQFGEVDDDWIRAHAGPTKVRREQHEVELRRLESQRVTLKQLEGTEGRLRTYCERIRSNLDSLDFEEKRKALNALQIRATVETDHVRISGILGVTGGEPDLATTARTSG